MHALITEIFGIRFVEAEKGVQGRFGLVPLGHIKLEENYYDVNNSECKEQKVIGGFSLVFYFPSGFLFV